MAGVQFACSLMARHLWLGSGAVGWDVSLGDDPNVFAQTFDFVGVAAGTHDAAVPVSLLGVPFLDRAMGLTSPSDRNPVSRLAGTPPQRGELHGGRFTVSRRPARGGAWPAPNRGFESVSRG